MAPERQPDFVVDSQGNVRDLRTERSGRKQGGSSSYVGWTAGSGVGVLVLLLLLKGFVALDRAQKADNATPSGQQKQAQFALERWVLENWIGDRPEAVIGHVEKTLKERFHDNPAMASELIARLKKQLEDRLGPSLPEDQSRRYHILLQRLEAIERRLENMKVRGKLTTGQALALEAGTCLGLATAPNPALHLTGAVILVSVPDQLPGGGPAR
jgi:hypothetical protein